MYGKMLGSLVIAALLSSHPALAADEIERTAAPTDTTGIRIEGTRDRFQLVTHGVWRPATPLIMVQAETSGSARVNASPVRHLKPRSASSSFRRAAYLPHVYAAEIQNRLPTGLLDALIWTESRYNPFAISRAGAAGLGQLMPSTARELGVVNRFDPRSNLSGAARYLRQMLDRFGLVHLALAAYNAGPGAVERAGRVPQNGETPDYVQRVIEFWGSKRF